MIALLAAAGAGACTLLTVAAIAGHATPVARSATSSTTRRGVRSRWSDVLGVVARPVRSGRRRRAVRADVPAADVAAWCDAIGRRLRAGAALRHVLATERPAHVGLAARTESLRHDIDRGGSVSAAIDAASTATGPGTLGLVWSVLAVTSEHGGSAAEAIDRVSSALRLRSADAHERAAQSAQARLSAHVLTAVPLGVLGLLVATDPDVRRVVGQPMGWGLIGAGLLLNLCGWQWMRRISAGTAS